MIIRGNINVILFIFTWLKKFFLHLLTYQLAFPILATLKGYYINLPFGSYYVIRY